jgi:2-iminobutanoate/2-iminopropanoate deaminase
MPSGQNDVPSIAIIGGGFTGTVFAVHAHAASAFPAIEISAARCGRRRRKAPPTLGTSRARSLLVFPSLRIGNVISLGDNRRNRVNRYIKVESAAPPPKTARYSHAVEAGGALYVTGQLPIDPDNPSAPLPETIEQQSELSFVNLKRIVNAAGYDLSDTVFVRIFLSHFDRDYVGLNSVYHRYFNDDDAMPARTTVGVAKLGRNALVEIDLILVRRD